MTLISEDVEEVAAYHVGDMQKLVVTTGSWGIAGPPLNTRQYWLLYDVCVRSTMASVTSF